MACRKVNYRKRNPEHTRIIQAVRDAVKRGELIKPDACEACSEVVEPRLLTGHHDDYARPMDVRWLCPCCHRAWHKEHGRGANFPGAEEETHVEGELLAQAVRGRHRARTQQDRPAGSARPGARAPQGAGADPRRHSLAAQEARS